MSRAQRERRAGAGASRKKRLIIHYLAICRLISQKLLLSCASGAWVAGPRAQCSVHACRTEDCTPHFRAGPAQSWASTWQLEEGERSPRSNLLPRPHPNSEGGPAAGCSYLCAPHQVAHSLPRRGTSLSPHPRPTEVAVVAAIWLMMDFRGGTGGGRRSLHSCAWGAFLDMANGGGG